MKTKFWSVAVALVALLLCGSVILAHSQEQANGVNSAPVWQGHKHGHMGYLYKQLNLTDAQKQQIKTIMQANRANTRPLMQQMAQARVALLTATSNGAFDQAKVQSLATQQAQLMAQLMVQKASIQHQIYTQVLTADQRTKADQMRQNQIQRIDQRLQKWSQSGTEAPGE